MKTATVIVDGLWIEEGFVPEAEALYNHLIRTANWDERMRVRKTASYGSPYNYSGITYPVAPFPDALLPLLDRLERRHGYQPNNCLANYYPDGASTMGFHADSTEELVPGTGIAIVSLGAERSITFRSQSDKRVTGDFLLRKGSLLHMTAEVQGSWKHAILAQPEMGGRISLTFLCLRTV